MNFNEQAKQLRAPALSGSIGGIDGSGIAGLQQAGAATPLTLCGAFGKLIELASNCANRASSLADKVSGTEPQDPCENKPSAACMLDLAIEVNRHLTRLHGELDRLERAVG